MRIKLQKGKQKELICLARKGLSWQKFSEIMGTSQVYLSNDLRYERRLISKDIYRKLCRISNKDFGRFILEELDEKWGQSKGGMNSEGSLIKLKLPSKSKELAEFVGSVLGDGNVNSYKKGKKVGVYCVRISGDKNKDEDYHVRYLKKLGKGLFGLEGGEKVEKNNNGRSINFYSKQLVEFFVNMGIKPGNKITNQSTIPRWIFKKNLYLKSCIRGLIDTDGSIFRMSKRDSHLIRISFTNYNLKLLQDTRNAFIRLGFHPSKITYRHKFYISRQAEVKKYLKEVGFSNKKHLDRVKVMIAP